MQSRAPLEDFCNRSSDLLTTSVTCLSRDFAAHPQYLSRSHFLALFVYRLFSALKLNRVWPRFFLSALLCNYLPPQVTLCTTLDMDNNPLLQILDPPLPVPRPSL